MIRNRIRTDVSGGRHPNRLHPKLARGWHLLPHPPVELPAQPGVETFVGAVAKNKGLCPMKGFEPAGVAHFNRQPRLGRPGFQECPQVLKQERGIVRGELQEQGPQAGSELAHHLKELVRLLQMLHQPSRRGLCCAAAWGRSGRFRGFPRPNAGSCPARGWHKRSCCPRPW